MALEHQAEAFWEYRAIAQVRQRFAQQGHATAVDMPAAGEHRCKIGRGQQEMLHHLLKRVGRLEVRISSAHETPALAREQNSFTIS